MLGTHARGMRTLEGLLIFRKAPCSCLQLEVESHHIDEVRDLYPSRLERRRGHTQGQVSMKSFYLFIGIPNILLSRFLLQEGQLWCLKRQRGQYRSKSIVGGFRVEEWFRLRDVLYDSSEMKGDGC